MEGGIRTPGFIVGGMIDEMLKEYGVTECEYNEMVHISDWYKMFTDIANIMQTESDSDHESLQIWQDIQCML